MKRLEATEENLAAEVKRWSKILRLQDWRIKSQFVHHTSLASHLRAEVRIIDSDKAAYLDIVWPSEYPDDWDLSRDWQHGLLHECLEILFERFKPKEDEPNHVDAEVAINLIASALLELDRKTEDAGIIEVIETK